LRCQTVRGYDRRRRSRTCARRSRARDVCNAVAALTADDAQFASDELGPVSPELVLVSPPEVAALARQQLDERARLPQREKPPVEDADRDEATHDPPSTPAPRRRRGRRLLTVSFAAIAVTASFIAGRQSRAGGAAPQVEAHPTRAITPSAPLARTRPPADRRTKRRHVPHEPPRSRRPPARSRRPVAVDPGQRGRQHSLRVFAWPASAGARVYLVKFFRDGRPLFETRSRTHSVQVPAHLLRAVGRYRWKVVPMRTQRHGSRYGAAIIDSTFKIASGRTRP
jgi:hypothetical protein